MAELKLSTVWQIKDFAERNAENANAGGVCIFESEELPDLQHNSLPKVKWTAELTTSPNSFFLNARFGVATEDIEYVFADFNATLCNENGEDVAVYNFGRYTPFARQPESDKADFWGNHEVFSDADLERAISKAGALSIRIDLTILNITELLNCRDLLRGLLANETHADFDVKVGEESFKLHKSVLAGRSNVFAAMFESGMEEAADGVLTLPDTNAVAFNAFIKSVYFDSWDFLANVDVTQGVLYLAEKFDIGNLKRYCDASLAEKITDSNALEILTKCAALCNAEKTVSACAEILADNIDFKNSDVWLDFKKRHRGVALEILDVISDKLGAANERLKRDYRELEAKYEEEASTSKRFRSMAFEVDDIDIVFN